MTTETEPRTCRICGCTDANACSPRWRGDTPCSWVDETLCSHCYERTVTAPVFRDGPPASHPDAHSPDASTPRIRIPITQRAIVAVRTFGDQCADDCPYICWASRHVAYCHLFIKQHALGPAPRRLITAEQGHAKRLPQCFQTTRQRAL